MSKLAWIIGGLVSLVVGGVVVYALAEQTSGAQTATVLTPVNTTKTIPITSTAPPLNIINSGAIISSFPNAVVNTSTGLITTGNIPINEILSLNGVATSTNSTPTNLPNVVVGTESFAGTGQYGGQSATVYSSGSSFLGGGEYVSSSGAPEYISSVAQYNQQKSLGFIG